MTKISGIIISVSLLLIPLAAFAQSNPYTTTPSNPAVSSNGAAYTIQNPLGNINSFCGLVKALLTAALDIGIPIAVLFIVYAGFKFVLARGNSEKLKEARQNMLWTMVGIAIFLGAWLLAQVVANTVNSLGGGGPSLISCK